MSARFAAVKVGDETRVHAVPESGNYATLCGISDDDDPENGEPASLPSRPRVTCDDCRRIIIHCRQYKIRAA